MSKKAGAPRSEGELSKFVLAYARQHGLDVSRVRSWISYMMFADVLERRRNPDDHPAFIFKGGVVMELRLHRRARATQDVDLILEHPSADLVAELEQAIAKESNGFTFRRKGDPIVMLNGAVRMEIQVTFKGKPWTTIPVDLARFEAGGTEVERLPAIPLQEFGIEGPAFITCIALHQHIAQKLHGVTRPGSQEHPNDRFRDIVDILLLREMIADLSQLRSPCEILFKARGTHPWPPEFNPPTTWSAPFSQMAVAIGLPITTLEAGSKMVRSLIEGIANMSRLPEIRSAEPHSIDGLELTGPLSLE